MKICVDVAYGRQIGMAVGIGFTGWSDEEPTAVYEAVVQSPPDYEPGRFYLRELPAVLQVLGQLSERPEVVVIDGYVWLGEGRPGLGAYLYQESGRIPVIGIAKSLFVGAAKVSEQVFRGRSRRPLYVTAAGVDRREAAGYVAAMAGRNRIPDLMRLADRLAREGLCKIRAARR